MFSEGAGAVGIGSGSGVATSEWEFIRCPQLLHLVSFDLFGTKDTQEQGVLFLVKPEQVVGMEEVG